MTSIELFAVIGACTVWAILVWAVIYSVDKGMDSLSNPYKVWVIMINDD